MEVQDMEDHRSNGGLSMGTCNDHSGFVFRLLVQELGLGIDLQPQFFGSGQLRVVLMGMHA